MEGAVRPTRSSSSLEAAATGATFGVALWVAITIILVPVIAKGWPQWNAAGMRAAFPWLVAWILFGFVFGFAWPRLALVLPRARKSPQAKPCRVRIVILGGGFAGITTAKALERAYAFDPDVELTLISDTNALLFTPMLAEVAGSSLEPTHISSPTRTALHRTTFFRARVTGMDFERRVVTANDKTFPYDHLVLALGSVTQYLGLENVQQHSFGLKTLLDAITIRSHVIEMLERADRCDDSKARKSLLTFVVAGGGFAGVELAGALNDFARGIAVDYPRLSNEEITVLLVHSGARVLPELTASLGQYAFERMQARGIAFKLNSRVTDATATSVSLNNGEEIETSTLVWTAGSAPNPLLRELDLPCDKRGAVTVDETLAVKLHANVWALGDCAAIPNSETGTLCPPTAQFAIQEARLVASNIRAAIGGKQLKKLHYRSSGALCVVGYQTACAELTLPLRAEAIRFSGFFAWLLWRGIYLSKLPGAERKLRVLLDWSIGLFFPPDIVQTIDLPA
jgi:NADH:ubiquinone reductase (H+-translocating)